MRPSWEFPANPDEPYIHNRLFVPLDLAVAAAMLREEGIGVRIVDAHALRLRPSEVAALTRDCDLTFLTSSALDRWECPNTDIAPFVANARALAQNPGRLVLMGVHGTVRPQAVIQETGVEAAILGEPELAAVEIARGTPLAEVPGLVLRGAEGNSAPTFTPPRDQYLDLNATPLPAFDLLPMDAYEHVIMGPGSVMLEGSRGCPFRCTTCLQAMYGPRYRKKSGQRLIREVRFAVEEHGARNITFIDMEFCLNRAAVEELCDWLIQHRLGVQWCCSTRADGVSEGLLRKMRDAGCTLIHYGVESGDQTMVDHINKKLKLEQVERAVRQTQKLGMEALAFFMFGLPGETARQMAETSRFARKLNPDYVSYHIFTPYPCTTAFEEIGAPAQPLFPTSSGQTDEAELSRVVKRAMLDFYLRPAFALRYAKNVWRRGILNQAKLFLRYIK